MAQERHGDFIRREPHGCAEDGAGRRHGPPVRVGAVSRAHRRAKQVMRERRGKTKFLSPPSHAHFHASGRRYRPSSPPPEGTASDPAEIEHGMVPGRMRWIGSCTQACCARHSSPRDSTGRLNGSASAATTTDLKRLTSRMEELAEPATSSASIAADSHSD